MELHEEQDHEGDKSVSLRWYSCRYCGTVLKAQAYPSSYHCPSNIYHIWTNLGEVGTKRYQCVKCEMQVDTDSLPSSWGCSKAGFHSWIRV